MALKLLQGPIDFTPEPTEPDWVGIDVTYEEGVQTMWLDDIGIIGPPEIALGFAAMTVTNLDGVFSPRSFGQGITSGSRITYDYHTNKLLYWDNSINIPHTIEPLTGAIYNGIAESLGTTQPSTRVPDRWLRVLGASTIQYAPLTDTTNSFVAEYVFSPSPSFSTGFCVVSPGPGTTVFIHSGRADANGTICQYDWLNKTEVLPRRYVGATYEAVFYSRKFDIFIGWDFDPLNTDLGQLFIWANEFEPTALSAPVAVTPITQGRVSTIQTTLTDSEGQPVPDRRIDWSITVGNGTLSTTQSVTDENGVAEVDYRAELSGGVDPTIQASLTY
jgi:hypothetical protein